MEIIVSLAPVQAPLSTANLMLAIGGDPTWWDVGTVRALLIPRIRRHREE